MDQILGRSSIPGQHRWLRGALQDQIGRGPDTGEVLHRPDIAVDEFHPGRVQPWDVQLAAPPAKVIECGYLGIRMVPPDGKRQGGTHKPSAACDQYAVMH